jgi:hypothetical protein
VLGKSVSQETSAEVPIIAGSFITSPAAVMELAASPQTNKAAALYDLIFQAPNSCHNTNATSGAIAGEG